MATIRKSSGQLNALAHKLAMLETRIKKVKGLSEDYCSRVDHHISEREKKKIGNNKECGKEKVNLEKSLEVITPKKKKRAPIYMYDGFENFRYI